MPDLPRYLEPPVHQRPQYESVTPRQIKVPSDGALENLSKLTMSGWADQPVEMEDLRQVFRELAAGQNIRARLEPKKAKGQFRTLWIPYEPRAPETRPHQTMYGYVLKRLQDVLSTLPTSPETFAFRNGLPSLRGLRGMVDEYEQACDKAGVSKIQTGNDEGHIIHTFYGADIKNYYGTITYEQVHTFLQERFRRLLSTRLSEEEIDEMVEAMVDLVCPGEVLPQGFSTSPDIANGVGATLIDPHVRRGVRSLLGSQPSVAGRYADDIFVFAGGKYDDRVMGLMEDVLDRQGFAMHPKKRSVVRASEEGRKSRIHTMGVEFRNDGDGPLWFRALSSTVRDVKATLKYFLQQDPEGIEAAISHEEELPRNRRKVTRQVQRLMGGMGWIRDTLRWGLPAGATLRKNQEMLLPRDLEQYWNWLRVKWEKAGVITPQQSTNYKLSSSQVEVRYREKTMAEVLDYAFPFWEFETTHAEDQDDPSEGGQFKVFAAREEGGKQGELLFEVNKGNMGLPYDSEDIEDFLMGKEETLRDTLIPALFEAIDEAEITTFEALQAHETIFPQMQEVLRELVTLHLMVALNIPGLSRDEFENMAEDNLFTFDGASTKLCKDQATLVLPWGIEEEVFDLFFKEYSARFKHEPGENLVDSFGRRLERIFLMPRHRIKKANRLFMPQDSDRLTPSHDGRIRSSSGSFMRLPGFPSDHEKPVPLRVVSGFPLPDKDSEEEAAHQRAKNKEGTPGVDKPFAKVAPPPSTRKV